MTVARALLVLLQYSVYCLACCSTHKLVGCAYKSHNAQTEEKKPDVTRH
jgi:hypothetical protein